MIASAGGAAGHLAVDVDDPARGSCGRSSCRRGGRFRRRTRPVRPSCTSLPLSPDDVRLPPGRRLPSAMRARQREARPAAGSTSPGTCSTRGRQPVEGASCSVSAMFSVETRRTARPSAWSVYEDAAAAWSASALVSTSTTPGSRASRLRDAPAGGDQLRRRACRAGRRPRP